MLSTFWWDKFDSYSRATQFGSRCSVMKIFGARFPPLLNIGAGWNCTDGRFRVLGTSTLVSFLTKILTLNDLGRGLDWWRTTHWLNGSAIWEEWIQNRPNLKSAFYFAGLSYNRIRNCDFDLRKNKKLGILISSRSGGRGSHSPSDTDTHTHTLTHTLENTHENSQTRAWWIHRQIDQSNGRKDSQRKKIFSYSFFQIHFWGAFLGATKHLYNWLCLSVGWSVG